MVPVVVPAISEYAALTGCGKAWLLVLRAGVGTLLGFGTAGTSCVGVTLFPEYVSAW